MKRKILWVAVLLLLLLPVLGFAQRTTGRRAPSTFDLTVNTNVNGATIRIDGAPMKGNTENLPAGSYHVKVTASGYHDWEQQVTLDANKTVTATLQLIQYKLEVDSNVKAAQVYIDGRSQGNVYYSAQMRPGRYTVRVTSSGYQDWETSVNLDRNQKVVANLQPARGRVQVNFSPSVLNTREKDPQGMVQVLVNGTPQRGTSFELDPGRHELEIISGGLSVKQVITVQPGGSQTIEPFLGINVR